MLCKDWAEANDHIITRVYHEIAITGKTAIERRIALPELIAAVKDKKNRVFDGVVVWKTDRMMRNPGEIYRVMEIFDKHKCEFFSVMDPVKRDTASERFLFGVLAQSAAYERELIGERVYAGQLNKFLKGGWCGHPVPLGFEWDKPNERFVLTDRIVDVITVFETFITCNGNGARTAQRLNSAGVISPQGNAWTTTTVYSTVRQPMYRQQLVFGDRVRSAEDIIPESVPAILLVQVDPLMQRCAEFAPRQMPGDNIYSGLLRCAVCGSNLIAGGANFRTQRYVGWICRLVRRGLCDARQISGKYIDAMLGLAIEELVRRIQAELAAAGKRRKTPKAKKPVVSRKRVEELKRARERYLDAWAMGLIATQEELLRKIGEVDSKLMEAERVSKTDEQPDISILLNALSSIGANWDDIPGERRRGLLLAIGGEITVSNPAGKPMRMELRCNLVETAIVVEASSRGTRWGLSAIDVIQ